MRLATTGRPTTTPSASAAVVTGFAAPETALTTDRSLQLISTAGDLTRSYVLILSDREYLGAAVCSSVS
jgi:hypothetical protein